MSIALLVLTDGRDDCLDRCLTSAAELLGPVTEWWMHDDTGNPVYRQRLAGRYPTFRQLDDGGPRVGFGGAIGRCWQHLASHSRARYVFHLEQDFVFRRPVDLAAMAAVLHDRPHLVHLALRRQAWNRAEVAAGGVVECNPTAYQDQAYGDAAWLEHREFFTTNPSLYRRSLCQMVWPAGAESEGRFGALLLRDGTPETVGADIQFGYWGGRHSGEWVEHIGHQRVGTGY